MSDKQKATFESGFALVPESGDETKDAEHTGANLLPCNAAARLQARASRQRMSPLSQLDQVLERVIDELTLRMLARRWSEFDAVWECTNKICDRYEETRAA